MRKTILTTCLLLYFSSFVLSQKEKDSSRHSKIDFNYKLAVQYKDGRGVEMDYVKAFNYFLEAANLGDAQSVYAIAYMYYKGLGCKQNYDTAALLFREGAALEKENSLYFYGLCWRNGYGLPKNEDSAKYYLNKAAALNYKQAALELQSIIGENSNDSAAAALVQQIHNAAISDKTVFNHFKKITPHLHAIDIVVGDYSGWLLQYDWSGSHIVSSKKLQLNINADNNSLTGQWIEDRGDTAKIRASLAEDSLLFNDTKYKRKDHYSMENGVLYKFNNAKLNLVQAGDSVFIAGTVEMFSPERGEPSKPLFVVLSRLGFIDTTTKLVVKAFPNPFTNTITVEFELANNDYVEAQLISLNGEILYRNVAGILTKGWYNLPIKVNNIASGVYMVKFVHGKQYTIVKMVKQ